MLYFHPFDLPKRVPLESFAIEGNESFQSVVVVIENRDEFFKAKLAVGVPPAFVVFRVANASFRICHTPFGRNWFVLDTS